VRDLQAKATMLKIADSYQHLADHAMKRAKREL
jgi:hypothetical protein